jgi:hypothetical protein
MNNWFANIVDDVDNLYVEIDNLNEPSVGFFVLVTRFKQTRNANPFRENMIKSKTMPKLINSSTKQQTDKGRRYTDGQTTRSNDQHHQTTIDPQLKLRKPYATTSSAYYCLRQRTCCCTLTITASIAASISSHPACRCQ